MKISEYIKILQDVQSEHGDLNVKKMSIDGGIREPPSPRTEYMKILSKRETKARYWGTWEGEGLKGEKVIAI